MRNGLIGAGLMGEGIGASLLRHGHTLMVKAHRNRAPIEALKAQGAAEASTLAEIAANAEVIIICVSAAEIVEATVAGLTPGLKAGQTVIDCGTTRPETTRKLAAQLAKLGILYADAPLTGGPAEAQRGELGALAGADDRTFARIEPVLKCFASTIRRFGPPGSGHTAKLISNYLVTGMVPGHRCVHSRQGREHRCLGVIRCHAERFGQFRGLAQDGRASTQRRFRGLPVRAGQCRQGHRLLRRTGEGLRAQQ